MSAEMFSTPLHGWALCVWSAATGRSNGPEHPRGVFYWTSLGPCMRGCLPLGFFLSGGSVCSCVRLSNACPSFVWQPWVAQSRSRPGAAAPRVPVNRIIKPFWSPALPAFPSVNFFRYSSVPGSVSDKRVRNFKRSISFHVLIPVADTH